MHLYCKAMSGRWMGGGHKANEVSETQSPVKDVYFKMLQVNYSPGLKVSEIAHSPVKLPPQGYGGTSLYVLCLFLLICLISNIGCLVGHR